MVTDYNSFRLYHPCFICAYPWLNSCLQEPILSCSLRSFVAKDLVYPL